MSILEDTGPTTITQTWYVNGVPTDVGAITIGIVDADGTTVVSAGTPTTNAGSGVYTYSLAVQPQVTVLTITWTAGAQSQTAELEIVGGWMFTIDELRTFQDADLNSTSTYPTDDLVSIRDSVADEFETICGVAFTPRYYRQILAGNGESEIDVEKAKLQTVLAATITGTVVAASSFQVHELLPVVYRTNGTFGSPSRTNPRNVTISYRHGHTTVPHDIHRAALIVARERAVSDISGTGPPERASAWTDASGTFQAFAANPDNDRWYGMKSVDMALVKHRLLEPVF